MIIQATKKDLTEILNIIEEIKKEMKEENNLQWSGDYPNCKIPKDIEKGNLYIYKKENKIKGFLVIEEDEGGYNELIQNSQEKSYILHRMCVQKEYRRLGIGVSLLRFAEKKAIENNIKILKADTEEKNTKMNQVFLKLNYQKIGIFTYEDYPGTYIYYEKVVGSELK